MWDNISYLIWCHPISAHLIPKINPPALVYLFIYLLVFQKNYSAGVCAHAETNTYGNNTLLVPSKRIHARSLLAFFLQLASFVCSITFRLLRISFCATQVQQKHFLHWRWWGVYGHYYPEKLNIEWNQTKLLTFTSRKQSFSPGLTRTLIPVLLWTGTNGRNSPGSWGRGPAGPRGPLVPVRLSPLVSISD